MQGNILTYSEESDEGLITGPGGSRYKFSKADWKENCPVISRVNVDFVTEGERATEIYCTDTDAMNDALDRIEEEESAQRKRIEAQKLKLEKAELKNEFSGFYRSSDKKLWKGVLGGLAHKYGHRVFAYRIMPFALLLTAFVTKDRDSFGGLFYIFILICFTLFYFYAAKKWSPKETESISAKIYFSEAESKFAEKVNSAAIIIGALAGKGPNDSQSSPSSSPIKNSNSEPIKTSDFTQDSNKIAPQAQTSNIQKNDNPFKPATPIAITGSVIGKVSEDSFEYYEKCEACGFVRTYSPKSERRSGWQSTMGGVFYCPKCSNLQKVEIKTV